MRECGQVNEVMNSWIIPRPQTLETQLNTIELAMMASSESEQPQNRHQLEDASSKEVVADWTLDPPHCTLGGYYTHTHIHTQNSSACYD